MVLNGDGDGNDNDEQVLHRGQHASRQVLPQGPFKTQRAYYVNFPKIPRLRYAQSLRVACKPGHEATAGWFVDRRYVTRSLSLLG